MVSGWTRVSVSRVDVPPSHSSSGLTHPLSLLSKVPLATNIYGLIVPNAGLGFAIGKESLAGLRDPAHTQPRDEPARPSGFGQGWWTPP